MEAGRRIIIARASAHICTLARGRLTRWQRLRVCRPSQRQVPESVVICAVRNGHIKRITDQDIRSSVLEVMSTNVSTTYISCPGDPTKTLGIKLPFLVMLIKNLKKYFSFEVQVLDDKNVRRRFRASNYQVSQTIAGSCHVASQRAEHIAGRVSNMSRIVSNLLAQCFL